MKPTSLYAVLIFFSLFSPIISLVFSGVKRRWSIANTAALAGIATTFGIWLMTILKVGIASPFALVHFTPVTSTVLLLVHFILLVMWCLSMPCKTLSSTKITNAFYNGFW